VGDTLDVIGAGEYPYDRAFHAAAGDPQSYWCTTGAVKVVAGFGVFTEVLTGCLVLFV
jgi:hypothetical protein